MSASAQEAGQQAAPQAAPQTGRQAAQHAAQPAVEAAVAATFQAEWGRVVATLIRTTGDWDLAEECAQDAFAQALRRWPRDGVPDRPGAWLKIGRAHV